MGKIITKYGDVKTIQFNKWENKGVCVFNGTSDYLVIPHHDNFNFSDSFTLDFWINQTGNVSGYWGSAALFGKRSGLTNTYGPLIINIDNSGVITLVGSTNNSAWDLFAGAVVGTVTRNTWNHVAVVRNGTSWYCFINGILLNTYTRSSSPLVNTYNVTIGGESSESYPCYFNGMLCDFRFTKGQALWTSNFTVPSLEYKRKTFNNIALPDRAKGITATSNVSGGIDGHTKLYLTMDGTDGQVTFPDSSDANATVTKYGDAKITKHPIVGETKCLSFDGTGDYLIVNDSEDFTLSDSDFTIDYWVRHNTLSSSWYNQQVHLSHQGRPDNNFGWSIYTDVNNNIFGFYYSTTGSNIIQITCQQSTNLTSNIWYHVAVVRYSNTISLYINGNRVANGTVSGSLFNTTAQLRIGYNHDTVNNPTNYFNGQLSSVRFSKGIARWTSNFTVPTSYSTVDAYTKLQINGSYIQDETSPSKTITVAGDTKVIQMYNWANYGVITLDGTGDYLSIPNNTSLELGASNFTIDFWINRTGMDTSGAMLIGMHNGSNAWYNLYIATDGKLRFAYTVATVTKDYYASQVMNTNTWYHVAIVRNSNTFTFYINGQDSGSWTESSAIDTVGSVLRIGSHGPVSSAFELYGILANIRITKGIARWTSNFTVPTAPYTRSTEVVRKVTQFNDRFDSFLDLDNNLLEITIPTPPGDRGIIGGGYNNSSGYIGTIEYLTISTSSNTLNFGNLTLARSGLGATSNGPSDRGVFGGGSSGSYSAVLDYVNIIIPTNATNFGNLTLAREGVTATSNTVRGIFGGGWTGSSSNVIDYIAIASTSNALDFGDLSTIRYYPSAFSNGSNNRGVFGGQYPTGNTIDYVNISVLSNALDFGDLTTSRGGLSSVSNSTNNRGIFGGGWNDSININVLDYITISSISNALDFGDLSIARCGISSTSNGINNRGTFNAGYYSPTTMHNVIDYVNITTLGNALDFGDTSLIKYNTNATSNA